MKLLNICFGMALMVDSSQSILHLLNMDTGRLITILLGVPLLFQLHQKFCGNNSSLKLKVHVGKARYIADR